MQPQNIRWVWTCTHMNVAMGWLSQQRWMEWANQFMVKTPSKRNHKWTQHVYIYIYIAKCQFPFEEPLCWAMLSRFVQPPFARGKCTPIAALQCRASNSKELLDSSMYFLSGAQGNKSVPVLTCIRTFSHKKNREMIQAYIHGLWKIVHHPYLAICIKHAISLRTGRTHCSILWFYTIAFCCVSRNLALGPRPTAL